MKLASDTTVRTVIYSLDPGDSPDLTGYYVRNGSFRPDQVRIQFTDGVLDGVRVEGPIVTPTGKLHSTGRRYWWRWDCHLWEPAWPPPDAPAVTVRAVAAANSKVS